ncbi:penicillin-binding protein [Streptomyces sp. A3M-1-3]|uniref:transglycosylase domain-containing protein n=1 Tax=Streptomyces sp. A3M-1-3 TaxID=2962044 RepID=UPI0020B781BA|nr:transglycosylase domain-containing protein [Streptomyces sp. A3M-1-3]MCP3818109.1 penicillin-binding protein [Streptomyces sp. A3M-1-3]
MSEHRRKPPQPQGGGRAAARQAAQQPPSGRRGATGRDVPAGSPSGSYEPERPYGGRAEARRAAQRSTGGRRRAPEGGGGHGGHGGGGRRGGGGQESGHGRGNPRPKKRFIDYPRSDKYGWGRWVPSWRLVGGTCLGFFALLMAGTGIALAMVGKPDPQKAAQAQNNVFYWDDDTQMAATGGDQNRQIVPIHKIPQTMQDAVIAAENASFETDKGVDPMGIGRAVFNMAMGGSTQGGSTITQQYVKNTYLEQDQTMKRKITELFISIKLGATEEKDVILAGYLNTAYYGRDAYGIQAAAQAYFKTDSEDLNPSQSAFLAALLKGPNLYNPDGGIGPGATAEENTKRAKLRWAWVLDREVEVGRMDRAERAKHTVFPKLVDSAQARSLAGQTGYLVETAKKYVMNKTGKTPEELDRGGYRIYTTFNQKRVNALSASVEKTRKEFLDEKKRPDKDKHVQFGAASVDPETGKIVALYGGKGWDQNHFTNNADTSGVPVGSTWKPYVLAAAMEYGTPNSGGDGLSPDSKYNGNDLAVITRNGQPLMNNKGQPFRQKNESPTPYGYVTLTEAMEKSINTPFAQLGMDVGLDKVRSVAKATGIREESMDPNDNASFSLGTSTPSAIRMADSYATFANSGTHYEPYSVTKVVKDGKELDGFKAPEEESAMDNTVADNITKVLENVVQNGTGKKAKELGRPAAGKTGTTDKNKSAWFVGYTPQLSTAVTLFRTDPEDKKLLSMNGTGGVPSIHGGDIPAEVWTNYMKEALKGQPVKDFPEAEDIGSKADADGAPTPTPTPSGTPSEEPDDKPSESVPPPSPSNSPGPTESCGPFDWDCEETGGTDAGTTTGTDAGTTTGTTGGASPSPSTPTGGNGNGNGGNGNGNSSTGGFFGGPGG